MQTHGWCAARACAGTAILPLVWSLTPLCSSRAPLGLPPIWQGISPCGGMYRVTIIAAMDTQGVVPVTIPVTGTTNGAFFLLWFTNLLLPALALRHPLGCDIILDNATIHQKALLHAAAAAYLNMHVLFLPPYAPELNPVRHPAREPVVAVSTG
jgi:DDE superfamily endonuclease